MLSTNKKTQYEGVCFLPYCRFRDGSIQQRAKTSVQTSQPMILHCQFNTVSCTKFTQLCYFNQVPAIQTGKTCRFKLDILFCSKQWAVILTYASVARRVGSFVELKLRLYILRWKGDADFNAACNATWGKKTWAVNTTSYQCLIPYGDISSNLCGSLQRTAVSVSRTWSIK